MKYIKIGYNETSRGIITGYVYIDENATMYYSEYYSEFRMKDEETVLGTFILSKFTAKQIKTMEVLP